MMPVLTIALLACGIAAALIYVAGYWATWRHTSERPALSPEAGLPPLTLLKPIKGVEEELEENLCSFFRQEYPAPVQLVFSSTEANDPGMAVARRIAARYPEADVSFVLADSGFGLNPKVANMQGALQAARYDTVLQTDANVRLRPGFLKRLAAEFVAKEASLLGCPVVGVGEQSVGAALENLQLTAFIGPAICGALRVANVTCILGKAMLFRRSELDQLGGLALVKDVLAEDFVLGEAYRAAGHTLGLSNAMAENVNVHTSVGRFLGRHSRWLKMTASISTPGFVGELFANPTPFALLAWISSGCGLGPLLLLLGFMALKSHLDARVVYKMRGSRLPPRFRWLSLVRDLAAAGLWVHALFSRTTHWRGVRLQLGPGSRIRGVQTMATDEQALAPTADARAVATARPAPDMKQ